MADAYLDLLQDRGVEYLFGNAGTANSIGGLINANRSQVPIFFTAGRTPLAESNALGVRDLTLRRLDSIEEATISIANV